jgi:error-prone DNA polymerase
VAIIRPGPIVGQMVNPYLQRRQGRAPVVYAHPSLEPVLARTLGVPLFQEQLLRMAMVVAGFTGGEAEELRRAMGFKRSQARMKEIETRLRAGMTRNGIARKAQEEIILAISSFALYGFPESHAASFALIAYASAYLKCHYLAAFTAALLNNQPMGFYRPATIVKDAQRHGLKILPIDVMWSEWSCTLEPVVSSRFSVPSSAVGQAPALRIGLRYARGLREEAARTLVHQRSLAAFTSIRDLVHRVPELRKDELNTLAEIGALNSVGYPPRRHGDTEKTGKPNKEFNKALQSTIKNQQSTISSVSPCLRGEKVFHRRDALWQVERAVRHSGPLLDELSEPDVQSPLRPMNEEERLVADFRGTGLTVGPHPMAYHRAQMTSLGIRRASELRNIPNGQPVRIGGGVIARQRPGTAKGFVFLSLEDETGVANAIVTPDLFQKNRLLLSSEQFLMVEGILQNQDNVISVKAERVRPLSITRAQTTSHDFY